MAGPSPGYSTAFCGNCAPVRRGGICPRYGPWKTAHERLRKWTMDGTWERILAEVVVKDDAVGEVEWIISVDSTVVRAHQHAAGARKKGAVRQRSSPSSWTGKDWAGPVAG